MCVNMGDKDWSEMTLKKWPFGATAYYLAKLILEALSKICVWVLFLVMFRDHLDSTLLLVLEGESASKHWRKPVLCSSSCSHSINLLSSADSDLGLKRLRLFCCWVDGTVIGNKIKQFGFCISVSLCGMHCKETWCKGWCMWNKAT